MKKYSTPQLDVVTLISSDVITMSPIQEEGTGDGFDYEDLF